MSKVLCHAYGATHVGRVRRSNEDAFFADGAAGVFVVCDGMGGAAAGETASHLATESVAAALQQQDPSRVRMEAAVALANTRVFERACSDRHLEGMGTTLVALALSEQSAWLAHVGDSRCYRWRDRQLEQLTADHSLVEEQIRIGRMTRREAERSPMQHVITRAVGTAAQVTPDLLELSLHPGDLFLLVSDGLTRELAHTTIASILSRESEEQPAVDSLISAAVAAGGRDNITCVLVRIS